MEESFGASIRALFRMAIDTALLAELRKARTLSYRALKKAAVALKNALNDKQTVLKDSIKNLETAWNDYTYEQGEFLEFIDKENLDHNSTEAVVNGKSLEEYDADAKKIYDDACALLKSYVSPDSKSDSKSSDSSAETPAASGTEVNVNDHSLMASFLSQNANPDSSFLRNNFVKQEYPVWNGVAGRTWLEWKVLWETEVVPLFRTRKVTLAQLLQKCVKGEGLREIEHIPLSDPECYDLMWQALIDRFDNIALNVRVVINTFSSFKLVRENDRKAMLDFIRNVKSAYAQLKALKQVDQVDTIAVTQLSSLMPNSMQESWAVVYSGLDASGRFHPFEKFVEFLNGKVKVVQAMVEMSNTVSSGTGNNSTFRSQKPAGKPASRSYAISGAVTSYACAMHPEGTHELSDCRAFQKMSAAEKSDMCTERNLCKRCFAPKHTGQRCDGEFSCKYCKNPKDANSHNELLCFRKHGYPEGKGIKKPYGGSQSKQFNAPKNHAAALENQFQNSEANQMPPGAVGTPFQAMPAYTMPSPYFLHPMGTGQAMGHVMPATINQLQYPYASYMPAMPQIIPGHTYVTGNGQMPGQIPVHGYGNSSNVIINTSEDGQVTASVHGTTSGPGDAQGESRSPPSASSLGTPGSKTQCVRGNSNLRPKVNGNHIALSAHIFNIVTDSNQINREHESQALKEHVFGIYAIYSANAVYADESAVIFCDDGSDCSLVSERGLEKLNGKVLSCGWMDMTTLHGTKSVATKLCEVCIRDQEGQAHTLVCYVVPSLCGMPTTLNEKILHEVFPQFAVKDIQRPTQEVDILLGADYFRLHPKHELASDGCNLSVMDGALGKCVQGAHRSLVSSTTANPYAGYRLTYRSAGNYAGCITSYRESTPTHARLNAVCNVIPSTNASPSEESRASTSITFLAEQSTSIAINPSNSSVDPSTHDVIEEPLPVDDRQDAEECPMLHMSSSLVMALAKGDFGDSIDRYILGEDLGTTCVPRCGACRCGKCPLPGHDFSFKEEQELALIQSKLRYLEDQNCWITGYPWIVDPATLPDNYPAAYSTLCRTERTLEKDPEWKAVYQKQIDDHKDRGVARKLTAEELRDWKGPYLYLSHMAIEQPKSESTPVRLVFNSSQKYKGVSLNDCLAKGPDCYNNSLLGMLIRFRENGTVLIGDIRKMYNTVLLEELETHMHRFLWRECDTSKQPDVWVITRVNLGDRPSGTIAITAKNNTAHLFAFIDEEAAQMLIYCVYTDDIINSIIGGFKRALTLSQNSEKILKKGGFGVKGWTYAGKDVPLEFKKKELQQVLGMFFNALRDVILFPARLNFSPLRRKVPTGPDLKEEDVPEGIPSALTRRIVLSQSLRSPYDPLGLLSPVTLTAKVLLRETWQDGLGWDEAMSPELAGKWKEYFTSLFEAAKIEFPRCLTPDDATGSPQLVLLSDGSETAYGCTAYIRWQLADGKYWCRLILAKSRIAPLNRVSIPQMELNAAVLSKRLREVIQEECRFTFTKVHHIIDSETVLCQLYKVAQRFRVFEGVRIGEIQAAMNGDMSEWAWVAGKANISDLTTRPQHPHVIGKGSEWINGPEFLYLPEEDWPVKRNPHVNESEPLPGEKLFSACLSSMFTACISHCVDHCACVHFCSFHNKTHKKDYLAQSLTRCSRLSVAVGAIARVKSIFDNKSFRGGRSEFATPELRQKVLRRMIEEAQCCTWTTEKEVAQVFRHVNVELYDKLWVASSRDPRLRKKQPLTPEHRPLTLLPPDHILTHRIMRDVHESGRHGGRDATLSLFRGKYHTTKASRLASAIVRGCSLCKLLKVKMLSQKMGLLPEERFSPSLPFDICMLDLFGPYLVQGEVNKRTSCKVWGVIFVDLVSRAVHIEIASGYDTKSFLISFRRFAAIRGYPSTVYSDPGTQLVGANAEMKAAFEALQGDEMISTLSQKGTRWIFGPADSPWYQGAAEALIKSAKFALSISVRKSRLSFAELLTVFTEAANLLNERPIGIMPDVDNDMKILTPNSLLLGRSTAMNPGGIDASASLYSRVNAVQDVVDEFWHQWTLLYAPTLLKQSKWTQETRPLQVGDVVLVADSNVMKGEYRLAVVEAVHPSQDGIVRRVSIRYTLYKSVGKDMQLKGGRSIIVERSVQRLSLIIPVEEQI